MEQNLEGVLMFWRLAGAANAKTEGFNNKIRRLVKQRTDPATTSTFGPPNLKPRDGDC